jgi:hypothetical protein
MMMMTMMTMTMIANACYGAICVCDDGHDDDAHVPTARACRHLLVVDQSAAHHDHDHADTTMEQEPLQQSYDDSTLRQCPVIHPRHCYI